MRGGDDAGAFYADVLRRLTWSGVDALVGGAFALSSYASVHRETKDLDLFIRQSDWGRVARAMESGGYVVELPYPHWLGKVWHGPHFVDVMYNSGNGLTPVDADWFTHARGAVVLGTPVKLCPPEETLWTKCFVQERERYDGADVAHLIRACGERLDWTRLLARFGDAWRVLLAHLVLYEFIYPADRDKVPTWVRDGLLRRAALEIGKGRSDDRRCRGSLLSRAQYLVDLREWGYADARRRAEGGGMSDEEIAIWTAAIRGEPPL
jgi:hypothetical protein